MPVIKKAVKANAKAKKKLSGKVPKNKLPEIKERRISRPDSEQLAILEKAIYHSFRMTFKHDASGSSKVFFNGEPVHGSAADGVKLNNFFKLIVQTYATL